MNKLIAPLAIAAVALSACGLTDVSGDDLKENLVEGGIPEETADCIVDDLEEQLSDDEFQEVAKADTFDEVDADLEAQAMAVVEACVTGG